MHFFTSKNPVSFFYYQNSFEISQEFPLVSFRCKAYSIPLSAQFRAFYFSFISLFLPMFNLMDCLTTSSSVSEDSWELDSIYLKKVNLFSIIITEEKTSSTSSFKKGTFSNIFLDFMTCSLQFHTNRTLSNI